MNEVKEGFDCNSPATDLELTFTTDFLPVEMFAMELEAEDMFVSDPEPCCHICLRARASSHVWPRGSTNPV